MSIRVATLEEMLYYGAKLPQGLIAPIAGGSGPALDAPLGINRSISSGTVSYITAAASIGELVIDMVWISQSTLSSFSDGTNSYTTVASRSASNRFIGILASVITNEIGGNTVTAHGGGTPVAMAIAGGSFIGCVANAVTTAYAIAYGTSGTVTSGVINEGDLVIFAVGRDSGTPTTPSGAWGIVEAANNAGLFWLQASSTATLTATSSGGNACVIVAFPAAPLPALFTTSSLNGVVSGPPGVA